MKKYLFIRLLILTPLLLSLGVIIVACGGKDGGGNPIPQDIGISPDFISTSVEILAASPGTYKALKKETPALPVAIYKYLKAHNIDVASMKIINNNDIPVNLQINLSIANLTATEIKSVELAPHSSKIVSFHPELKTDLSTILTTRPSYLNFELKDSKGNLLQHNSIKLEILPYNTLPASIIVPGKKKVLNCEKFLPDFVNPDLKTISNLIEEAKSYIAERKFEGYSMDRVKVIEQVEAIYNYLKSKNFTFTSQNFKRGVQKLKDISRCIAERKVNPLEMAIITATLLKKIKLKAQLVLSYNCILLSCIVDPASNEAIYFNPADINTKEFGESIFNGIKKYNELKNSENLTSLNI